MRTNLATIMYALGLATAALLPAKGAIAAPEIAMPLSSLSHVHGLEFEPDGSALLLATHQGLFRHEAGGPAILISPDRADYMGFILKSDGLALASGHPEAGGNSGVLESADLGANWRHVTDGALGPVDFHAMADAESHPQVVFGLHQGVVQYSTDGGTSWTVTGDGTLQIFDLASSADGSVLFASGPEGVSESRDAGASWKMIAGNIPIATSLVGVFGDQLYAYALTKGLLRRATGDATWQNVASDIGTAIPLHITLNPTDTSHLAAVTQENLVIESRDAGATWITRD